MLDLNSRILIVDDMSTMRKIMKKVLEDVGFKDIVQAEDGNVAWNLLLSSSPPVTFIISDWNMPNCTGIELLTKVRTHPQTKSLPFLMVTAESEKDQVLEASKKGVSGYIIKPFTPDIIKSKLAEISVT